MVWSTAARGFGTTEGVGGQAVATYVNWRGSGRLGQTLETTFLGVSVAGIAVLVVKDLMISLRWEESWVATYWDSILNAQGGRQCVCVAQG